MRFADRDAVLSDLTAVRGLLALWVFAYHANLHLHFAGVASLIGRGYLGVDGFFMLSGLVLAHRHPQPSQTLAAYGRFWWRRFVRLYPTALAMLMLLGAGLLLARVGGVHPHQAFRADGREFTLQLLMLNGWGFSHGWTWNYPVLVDQHGMGGLPAVSRARAPRLALQRAGRSGRRGCDGPRTTAAVRRLRHRPEPHV